MRQQLFLFGTSEPFTKRLREILYDCGFDPVVIKPEPSAVNAMDFYIFEADSREAASHLFERKDAAAFIIYSDMQFGAEELAPLKEKGLMGVITKSTTPEDIAFLVSKALFYNKMLKRNPRVPVSIPVEIQAGTKVIKTFSSLLSRDGMFIVTLNPLEVNFNITIGFSLPGIEKMFRTEAKVLYNIAINKDLNIIANPRDPFKRLVAHPGMAVFFTDMPQEDRELIDAYIESIL